MAIGKSAKKASTSTRTRAKAAARTFEKPVADTRRALLAAARRIFAQKGFEGATVKDLAEEAGVNISLVSYHFGGKEGLYRDCLESFGEERAEASERILSAPASREEFVLRLQLFAEDFIEFNLKNADTCKVVSRAMESAGSAGSNSDNNSGQGSMDDILSDVFKKFFFRIFQAFHSFNDSALQSGFLRPHLDTEITTVLMFGALMHMLRSREIAKLMGRPTLDDPAYRARFIQHWIKNYTQGIFITALPTDRRGTT